MLARALSATGTERSRVLEIAQAQARGDAQAVLEQTPACAREPACVAATEAFVAKLKRPGRRLDPPVPPVDPAAADARGRAPAASPGVPGDGLPVVQCVRVRRDGPLTGATVELLSISAPIGNEASCPP